MHYAGNALRLCEMASSKQGAAAQTGRLLALSNKSTMKAKLKKAASVKQASKRKRQLQNALGYKPLSGPKVRKAPRVKKFYARSESGSLPLLETASLACGSKHSFKYC